MKIKAISLVLLLVVGAVAYYLGSRSNGSLLVSKTQPTVSKKVSTSTDQIPTPNPIDSNWSIFTSLTCGFSVKTPENWKISDINNQSVLSFEHACSILTSPDYSVNGMESSNGLSIEFLRTEVDTATTDVKIKSMEDYLNVLNTLNGPENRIKNLKDTTFNKYSGKYFEFTTHQSNANFSFIRGEYIYTIRWNMEYSGQYKKDIEPILNSIYF